MNKKYLIPVLLLNVSIICAQKRSIEMGGLGEIGGGYNYADNTLLTNWAAQHAVNKVHSPLNNPEYFNMNFGFLKSNAYYGLEMGIAGLSCGIVSHMNLSTGIIAIERKNFLLIPKINLGCQETIIPDNYTKSDQSFYYRQEALFGGASVKAIWFPKVWQGNFYFSLEAGVNNNFYNFGWRHGYDSYTNGSRSKMIGSNVSYVPEEATGSVFIRLSIGLADIRRRK